MTVSVTKPTQIRVRIADEDMPTILELAGSVLSITDVASLLLNAAIDAVEANGGNVTFPPKFIVDTSTSKALQLNETRTPAKTRR